MLSNLESWLIRSFLAISVSYGNVLSILHNKNCPYVQSFIAILKSVDVQKSYFLGTIAEISLNFSITVVNLGPWQVNRKSYSWIQISLADWFIITLLKGCMIPAQTCLSVDVSQLGIRGHCIDEDCHYYCDCANRWRSSKLSEFRFVWIQT